MKVVGATIVSIMLVLFTGCGPAVYQQPVAVNTAAPQEVISGTCINNMQQVMDDYYCDPNWIAQQRAIAMQQNNQALLNSLLLYHMIYTPNPYAVGAYIPHSVIVYNTPPRNYIVQRRSVYVNNINNHTLSYSGGRTTTVARQTSTYSPASSTSSYSQRNSTFSRPSTTSSWSRSSSSSTTTSTPISRPTTSYSSRPSSSFGSSSSFSRPSSSSSFSRSSSSSSFGSRR